MVFCILLKLKLPVSVTIELILKWDLMSRFGIVRYKMVHIGIAFLGKGCQRSMTFKNFYVEGNSTQYPISYHCIFPPHGVPARKLLLLLHRAHQVVLDESSKATWRESKAFEVSKRQISKPSICISVYAFFLQILCISGIISLFLCPTVSLGFATSAVKS